MFFIFLFISFKIFSSSHANTKRHSTDNNFYGLTYAVQICKSWHILRFLAYAVALWFVIRGEEKILSELEEHRHHLAQQTRKYQQSEAQLKDAQSIAHLGSWRRDIKSGEAQWSDELFRIFGFKPKSVPSTLDTFSMILHDDDKDRFLDEYDNTITRGDPVELVCRIIRSNGEVRYLHISMMTNRDQNNQPSEVVGTALDITEQRERQERIEHLANHDTLTDLPSLLLSRERMNTELAHAKRDKTMFAIMFIDLDGFKQVNDTLGHDIGDILLKEVAKRLTSCLRDCYTVARIGGDEFLVLQTNVNNAGAVAYVAKKLIDSVANPYDIDKQVIQISASIGISLYPEHGDTTDLLMKKADQAMYQVKKNSKNSFEFAL